MLEWKENLEIIEKNIRNYDIDYKDYLEEKYKKYKYICVFGVGNIGLTTAEALQKSGITVDFFCDNDIKKNGKIFMNIPCYMPEILNDKKDETIVIVSTRYYREIVEQLNGMQVQNIDRVFTNKFGLKEKIEYYGKENVIEKIKKVISFLYDDKSKAIYTTILKNWVTLDYNQQELNEVYTDNQYFCEDIMEMGTNESFVDGGAYDGDTFEMFYNKVQGNFCAAYLFELSQSNYKKMLNNMEEYDIECRQKVKCINKGLSKESCSILYCDNDEGSTIDSVGETEGYLTSVDEVCKDENVTYIKLDIEGSEMSALEGAKQTIKEKRPKLAVCLYHKMEDFWELPLYIHELLPEYKLYIRHHTDLLNETVCYAV